MKTLAGVVTGYTDNLLLRAVDVSLKEQRREILVPRELRFGAASVRRARLHGNCGGGFACG